MSTDTLGFHAHSGQYFRRLDDGRVEIRNSDGVFVCDASTWASVVASVSARGETGETYRQALDFHQRLAAPEGAGQ